MEFYLPFIFLGLALIVMFIHVRWLKWFREKQPNKIILKTKIMKDYGLILMLIMAAAISFIHIYC